MVHRDFKPDNVMIDRSGRVRVLGFAGTPDAEPPDLCASTDALWRSTIAERVAEAAAGSGAVNVTNTAESPCNAAETIDGHRRVTSRDRAANRLGDDEHDLRMLCLDRRTRT